MAKGNRSIRIGRLVGACAVVGALLAGPLAGAGNAADLKSFAGQGTGFALRVVVDLSGLPTAAKSAIQTAYAPLAQASGGKLPAQFPFVVDQRFIETLSDLGKNTQAHALLGQGTISGLLPSSFNKSASATKVGQSSSVDSTPSDVTGGLGILNVGIGKLTAAIPSATKVTSSGNLASVSTSLTGLLDILPTDVKDAITAALAAVNETINDANAATGTLGTALDSVGQVLADTPVSSTLGGVLNQAGLGNAVGDPAEMVSTLQNLVQIPNVSDLLNSVAVSVNGVTNTGAAEMSAGKAFADASSKIASINVANLVRVGVVDLKSHSEATGVAGGARNSSQCSIANVNLANGVAGVSLDGKSLIVNGLPVPVPAVDVAALKSVINSVLNAAGLSVGLCDVANGRTAADGSSASQTLSALRIQFALPALPGNALGLASGAPLLKIIIDPSVETAASAQVASAAPAAQAPALPHTGAGAVATIITGMAVAGVALVLRRRLA